MKLCRRRKSKYSHAYRKKLKVSYYGRNVKKRFRALFGPNVLISQQESTQNDHAEGFQLKFVDFWPAGVDETP